MINKDENANSVQKEKEEKMELIVHQPGQGQNGVLSHRDDTEWKLTDSNKRIKLSICGEIFETHESTLARYPESLLGDPKRRQAFYDADKDVYFFDRHRPSFPAILYFYQSCGAMCRPLDVPMEIFVDEVMFYELTDLLLQKTPEEIAKENKPPLCRPRHRTCCEQSRELIWDTFEKPETSFLAKVINFVSIFFILLSVCSFCLETIPSFEENNCYIKVTEDYNQTIFNETNKPIWTMGILPDGTKDFGYLDKEVQRQDFDPLSKKFGFWVIETLCIAFFTIEFILRCWSCPDRFAFMRNFMNLIDLAAIIPYYIDMGVKLYLPDGPCPDSSFNKDGEAEENLSDKATFLMVLRVLRLARIVRIAKLSRHSRNLNTLIKTMSTSLRELSFLMLFFIVSMVLYATFAYYCEQNAEATGFTSIPASFWWAIVTMTTVGYGDMYPVTPMGKVVGFLCALTGVLCIALPVPSIVSNFHRLYQEDQIMNPNGNNTYKDETELKRCQLRKKFLNGD